MSNVITAVKETYLRPTTSPNTVENDDQHYVLSTSGLKLHSQNSQQSE
jgi:hypothetical protein